jgi:hypothetical protein
LIHNPESILFAWGQDEEEGAFSSADWTFLVEQIRCAKYDGQKTLDLNNLDAQIRQSTLTWINPYLLDNEPYGNMMMTMDYEGISSLRIDKITIQNHKVSIGESGEQIHFEIRNRNKYDSPELATKFQQYLNADKVGLETQIEDLCVKMDNMSNVGIQFKRLPSCFYDNLSIERRVDYIEKLAIDYEANIFYILSLINRMPSDGKTVLELFKRLNSKPNICEALYQKSSWTNKHKYKQLVQTLTMLFYKSILKEDVIDQVTQNYLFRWYREPKDFNIYYTTSLNANNDIEFNADLDYRIEDGNRRETIEYERRISIPAFSVVGVDFKTTVDFIGVQGQIFPMPAFYFNWMNQEYNRIERNQAIDVTVYALSFCFAVGEIRAAQNAWKIAVGLAGLAQSTGGLYFKLDEDVVEWLEMSNKGESFLAAWNAVGYVLTAYDGVQAGQDVFIEGRIPIFFALSNVWQEFSDEEKMELEKIMSKEEFSHLKEIINTFN